MTKIKFCGMGRCIDIEMANEQKPDYIGFVFAPKSKRNITYEKARELKALLSSQIKAVGVFVNEKPEYIAELLNENIIDMAQLHGDEEEEYIKQLKRLTKKPIIQAFLIRNEKDIEAARNSCADMILLDAGAGTGVTFDWKLIQNFNRPYFLAGGLTAENVEASISLLHPYGVDVSSGIETDGRKNKEKMIAFLEAVRKEECNYGE